MLGKKFLNTQLDYMLVDVVVGVMIRLYFQTDIVTLSKLFGIWSI